MTEKVNFYQHGGIFCFMEIKYQMTILQFINNNTFFTLFLNSFERAKTYD